MRHLAVPLRQHAACLTTYLLACCITVVEPREVRRPPVTITVAVFAPDNDEYDFSLRKISPAINLAIEQVHNTALADVANITVVTLDSQYPDETAVELKAIELIWNSSSHIHLFIGPFNDLGLSHVARISSATGMPVISPGGLSINFGVDKTSIHSKYKTLVRIGPNFNDMSSFLMYLIVDVHRFKRIKVICAKHDTVVNMCFYFHSALDYILNQSRNKKDRIRNFDLFQFSRNINHTELLLNEVNTEFAGHMITIIFRN